MKVRSVACCLMLAFSLAGLVVTASVTANAGDKPTVASVFEKQISGLESELVPAAEAMPADKYGFAPTQGEFKGVRSFGSQLKHIAAVNYIIGAAILGTSLPTEVGGGEDGPASITSKDQIVKFLKESFAYLHKAIGTITEANALEPIKAPWGTEKTTRLAMAITAVSHPFDHYGQMVEYLRMNGIIPPASRQ